MRKYYEANPAALKNKHLLPLHEALHATVCEVMGESWAKIVLRKTTGRIEWDRGTIKLKKWQVAAVEIAPALIDDMSEGDENQARKFSPRTRGYAWAWLKKNRDMLMVRANEIAAATNGPGILYNENGKLTWRSKTL